MKIAKATNHDVGHHVARIQEMLDDLINHCRQDASQVHEPKAQALFETTAEVLLGLKTAYQHYASGAEAAMRSQTTN
jgi:hypothetical protein